MPDQVLSEPKFNLQTHFFNSRGQLTKTNPYRLFVNAGVKLFERPKNSGNIFYENGEPAGRVEFVKDAKGRTTREINHDAAHIEYRAPLVGAEKLYAEMDEMKKANASILAELQAIRAEKAKLEAKLLQEANEKKAPPQAQGGVSAKTASAL